MKRFLSSLMILSALAFAFDGCSDDDEDDGTGGGTEIPPPPGEGDPAPSINFDQGTLSLGNAKGSTATAPFVSTLETFAASVETGKSWLEAAVEGKELVVKATDDNLADTPRTAVVTVTAGTGETTVSTTLTVIQLPVPEEPATLTLDPPSVELEGELNATKTVTLTSNKTHFTAAVIPGVTWLSATVNGNTLTLKALAANLGDEPLSTVVVVTAKGVTESISLDLPVTQNASLGLPTGTELGALYQGGILFQKSGNVGRVLSLTESPKVWALAATDVVPGLSAKNTNADTDGSVNTALIVAAPGYADGRFPAAKYCTDMGEGWYLPTRFEISYLLAANLAPIIAAQPGSTALDAGYYWTSSENANGNIHAQKATGAAGATTSVRTGSRPVRCVKQVSLTP